MWLWPAIYKSRFLVCAPSNPHWNTRCSLCLFCPCGPGLVSMAMREWFANARHNFAQTIESLIYPDIAEVYPLLLTIFTSDKFFPPFGTKIEQQWTEATGKKRDPSTYRHHTQHNICARAWEAHRVPGAGIANGKRIDIDFEMFDKSQGKFFVDCSAFVLGRMALAHPVSFIVRLPHRRWVSRKMHTQFGIIRKIGINNGGWILLALKILIYMCVHNVYILPNSLYTGLDSCL